MSERYKKSENLLKDALNIIPLASQTFSKSKTQFPYGVSPYFVEKGLGSKVWDVDGNEYVDFISGLASITLGYSNQRVNGSVAEQLAKGVTFSLSHKLEYEVAEKLVDKIPCAEMVRYAKNGSDVTAGAIRLARAYTGKDRIAVCGYHGWQDWYIGSTTRDLGVPRATKELTHSFEYNNIDSLEKLFEEYPGQFAGVILEPMNAFYPKGDFLKQVKELTHTHNALLIFDEIITGFRYEIGGAQEYFGVTPELATFGKGMANGFPLSALVGSRDVMKLMEDIFFSSTFGGETLSLAAANTVIDIYDEEPVIKTISALGTYLKVELEQLIDKYDADSIFSLAGHDPWTFILIKDDEQYSQWKIKTFYMQEMFKRGILNFGSHIINYSHTKEDINLLLKAYSEIIDETMGSIKAGTLDDKLQAKPLEPLFKVR